MSKRYTAKNGQVFLLCTQLDKIILAEFLLEVETTITELRKVKGLPYGWNAEDDNALTISRWILPHEYNGLDNDVAEHQLTTINKAMKKLGITPIKIKPTGTASSYEVKQHMDKARKRLADWQKNEKAKKDLENNKLFEFV